MKQVVLRGPLITSSGYGEHARQVFRWANSKKDWNVSTQLTPWGNTTWLINPDYMGGVIGDIMQRSGPLERVGSDISFQIQLPNEWTPGLGKKNIGVTAGVETDICSQPWVEACARQVATYSKDHTIVVEKSTLPVRTAEAIKSILKPNNKSSLEDPHKRSFDVLSNPEFLAEGSAINDLIKPDRVLIGGDNPKAIEALVEIYNNWVPKKKILVTNIWSSELAKLTANAFLAQRISSINSISALCEATGADVREVSRAIGSDTRIGAKFLDSGPGFGGSCLKKDILNLVYLSEYFGLPEVAKFWSEVVDLNNWHQGRISSLIIKNLFGTLSTKKIGVLGFAFKANTNDTRESAAIQICKDLLEEGAFLSIHDPKVDPKQIALDLNIEQDEDINNEASKICKDSGWISSNLENVFLNADAILIMTDWEEYFSINWLEESKKMRSPSWVFDTRSVTEPSKVREAGLKLWRIGDGS